jgi:hypothetical protein
MAMGGVNLGAELSIDEFCIGSRSNTGTLLYLTVHTGQGFLTASNAYQTTAFTDVKGEVKFSSSSFSPLPFGRI